MGTYRNNKIGLVVRILSFAVILLLGPITPWWFIFMLATALILMNISSVEIIPLGIFFDFFLLDIESGVYGLFYSLFFFCVVLISAVIGLLQQKNGA